VAGCCEADLDELTNRAMEALNAVASRLRRRPDDLSPNELRTYLWARSSLAVVRGIRAEAVDLGDAGQP
jgi:hypothetical protein